MTAEHRGTEMNRKKNLTKDEIFSVLHERRDILEKNRVKRIALFGSYAKDQQNEKSDIDFVVEFKEPTFDNFMNLYYDLKKLFGRKVEILTIAGVESIRVKEVKEDIKRTLVYA